MKSLYYALSGAIGLSATVLAFDFTPSPANGALLANIAIPHVVSEFGHACPDANIRAELARTLSAEGSLGTPLA